MKALSIINPVSGLKNAVSAYQKIDFEKIGIDSTPYITEYAGHAQTIVNNVSLSEYNAVIVFGGDGTIHEVVNGMLARADHLKLPLGIIPLGTGNALMHDLGLLQVEEALTTISQKRKKAMDIMRCEMDDQVLYSFNIVGWGMPQSINHLAEKFRFIGKQRYNLASIIEIIRNPRWPCKIKIDGQTITGNISFFMACNNQYTGNGMKIAPMASINDGKIDVILCKSLPRHRLISLFTQVFSGKHINHPDINYLNAVSVELEPSCRMPLNIDGQETGYAPLKISICPEEIELFC